jgi:hypothetical protein
MMKATTLPIQANLAAPDLPAEGDIPGSEAAARCRLSCWKPRAEARIRVAVAEALGTSLGTNFAALSQPVISRTIRQLTGLKNDAAEPVRRAATNSLQLIENSRSRTIK